MKFIIGEKKPVWFRERFECLRDDPSQVSDSDRVIGMQTRIGEHLIINAGLSSPFRPATPPTRADSFAVPA